jgi:dolichyl-phosphate beta-glucosyltransferase
VLDDGSRDWTIEVVKTIDIYEKEIKPQDVETVMEKAK